MFHFPSQLGAATQDNIHTPYGSPPSPSGDRIPQVEIVTRSERATYEQLQRRFENSLSVASLGGRVRWAPYQLPEPRRANIQATSQTFNDSDVIVAKVNRYAHSRLDQPDNEPDIEGDIALKDEEMLGIRNLGSNIAVIAMGYGFAEENSLPFRINALAHLSGDLKGFPEWIANFKDDLRTTYKSAQVGLQFFIFSLKPLTHDQREYIKEANLNGMLKNKIFISRSGPQQDIDVVVENDTIYYGENIIYNDDPDSSMLV